MPQILLGVSFFLGGLTQSIKAEPIAPSNQPQIIKFKLNELSGVSEWIRVEVTGSQVKMRHTVVAPSGLATKLTRLTILPISHTWHDHVTSRSVFRPKNCESSECLISGKESVLLPEGTTMYDGEFLLEYQENGWVRAITFKVPAPPSPPPLPVGVTNRIAPV